MNNKYLYNPTHLNALIREWGIRNKAYVEIEDNIINQTDFMTFLNTIASIPSEQVVFIIGDYSEKYIAQLARYVGNNVYKLNSENFYIALNYRFKKAYISLSYRGFQDGFGDEHFKSWFDSVCLKYNEFALNEHVDALKLSRYVDPLNPTKRFLDRIEKKGVNPEHIFEEFSINEKSQLGERIAIEYLASVSRELLLKYEVEKIISLIGNATHQNSAKILDNYLVKLKPSEFDKTVMNYILSKFKTPEKGNHPIWKLLSNNAIDAFDKWLDLKNIFELFGDDDRSRYWKRYIEIIQKTHLQYSKNQMAIDFGDIVVIEFKVVGAAYFYKKEDFDLHFLKDFSRPYSLHDSHFKDINMSIIKLSHSGKWMYRFHIELRNILGYQLLSLVEKR